MAPHVAAILLLAAPAASFSAPVLPRSALHLRGGFSPPPENFGKYAAFGTVQGKQATEKCVVQSLLAGAIIGLGCVLALSVGGAMPGIKSANVGLQKMLLGVFGLPTALLMVILSGGQLFTGNTALVTAAMLQGKVTLAELLKNWGISFFGNFAGALGTVYAVQAAGLLPNLAASTGIAAAKTAIPFGQAVIRGFLCNWMVCMAIWQQMSAGDIAGKFVGVVLPISAFVAMGFEHSIANMAFIPLGMLSGAQVSIGDFLLKNLLPVTLGNIAAGVVMVAGAYNFIYG